MVNFGVTAIRTIRLAALGAGASLALASPAWAQAIASIPEPTDLALFGLGVMGVIIGRQGSRKRPKD